MVDDFEYMLVVLFVVGIAEVECASFFVRMSGDIEIANGDSASLI